MDSPNDDLDYSFILDDDFDMIGSQAMVAVPVEADILAAKQVQSSEQLAEEQQPTRQTSRVRPGRRLFGDSRDYEHLPKEGADG